MRDAGEPERLEPNFLGRGPGRDQRACEMGAPLAGWAGDAVAGGDSREPPRPRPPRPPEGVAGACHPYEQARIMACYVGELKF